MSEIVEYNKAISRFIRSEGITTYAELSEYSEAQVLQWPGLGRISLNKLKLDLKRAGFDFCWPTIRTCNKENLRLAWDGKRRRND